MYCSFSGDDSCGLYLVTCSNHLLYLNKMFNLTAATLISKENLN